MAEKKKTCLNKPPVPARPKSLVVLNSKHLPKPPETFSAEKVTNFIKDLNLDVKDEGSAGSDKPSEESQDKYEAVISSDGEEDTYGYLQPLSLTSFNQTEGVVNGKFFNCQVNRRKSANEETCKIGEILRKVMNRHNSGSNDVPEIEESKPHISQNQWQRPLPLPPIQSQEVTSMPWYKNVDRKRGEEILRNGIDGYFLVRPSSNIDTYLTLTLWYNNRLYNIPIRKRKDGKFALGTPKTHEQCFETIEYMVKNYQSEKLVLYSNGVQTGKTLLTTYPP